MTLLLAAAATSAAADSHGMAGLLDRLAFDTCLPVIEAGMAEGAQVSPEEMETLGLQRLPDTTPFGEPSFLNAWGLSGRWLRFSDYFAAREDHERGCALEFMAQDAQAVRAAGMLWQKVERWAWDAPSEGWRHAEVPCPPGGICMHLSRAAPGDAARSESVEATLLLMEGGDARIEFRATSRLSQDGGEGSGG